MVAETFTDWLPVPSCKIDNGTSMPDSLRTSSTICAFEARSSGLSGMLPSSLSTTTLTPSAITSTS